MLTRKQIRKVARLMDQVGELRPGFLHDADASLDGASSACHAAMPSRRRPRGKTAPSSKVVRVRAEFETDKDTGEVQVVQK